MLFTHWVKSQNLEKSLKSLSKLSKTDFTLFLPVDSGWKGCCTFFERYAENDVPQPQPPLAFGLLNVKPEPITPLT